KTSIGSHCTSSIERGAAQDIRVNDKPNRLKHAMFFGVMILISLGLSFALLEVGLSTYYADTQSTNWSRFDSTRGWALVPGKYWVKPLHRMQSFPLTVNGYGMRDHGGDPAVKRDKRLIILGDSFTFAKETQTEKTFAKQLQDLLDRRHAGVAVLNGG